MKKTVFFQETPSKADELAQPLQVTPEKEDDIPAPAVEAPEQDAAPVEVEMQVDEVPDDNDNDMVTPAKRPNIQETTPDATLMPPPSTPIVPAKRRMSPEEAMSLLDDMDEDPTRHDIELDVDEDNNDESGSGSGESPNSDELSLDPTIFRMMEFDTPDDIPISPSIANAMQGRIDKYVATPTPTPPTRKRVVKKKNFALSDEKRIESMEKEIAEKERKKEAAQQRREAAAKKRQEAARKKAAKATTTTVSKKK